MNPKLSFLIRLDTMIVEEPRQQLCALSLPSHPQRFVILFIGIVSVFLMHFGVLRKTVYGRYVVLKVALVKGTSLLLHSALSFPHVCVSYTVVHHFLHLPPSSSLSSFCAHLQPTRLPSQRRRGLASVWSAQGGSVYTQFLPS